MEGKTMRFITILAMGVVGLSGCAPAMSGLDDVGAPNRSLAVDDACPTGQGFVVLGITPSVARQGATLSLSAVLQPEPWSAEPLPLACLSSVQVAPAGAATLDRSVGVITVADDAVPGTEVVVTAGFGGQTGSTRFRVVGRDQVVLTGTWRQDRVKCDPGLEPGEPVRELKFGDDGSFGATFQPFERYVDYWGSVEFDPATGAIDLSPSGGNFTPPLLDLEGQARLEGERRLILDGVYLGDRNERNFEPRRDDKGGWVTDGDGRPIVDRPVCTYEFVR
jgi:hypothetical protein